MKITNLVAEGFERLVRAENQAAGFLGFVAVHDTTLGPSLGGLRIWPYDSEGDAVTDVLRLSEAMTWKAAAANLPLGGGKAVMLADPHTGKTPDRLLEMAEVVELLGGSYITAEDVGIKAEDLRIMLQRTRHVTGLPEEDGGSGDPSPYTALGVLESIKVCLKHKGLTENLEGLSVAVQGLGNVGRQLVSLLVKAGAKVAGADVHPETAAAAASEFGIELLRPEEVMYAPCDVLAPCALGAVLNEATISKLRAKMVVGAANNQLKAPEDAKRLQDRAILYAPDFVTNAGGLINISVEIEPEGYRRDEALRRVKAIGPNLAQILARADTEGVTPDQAALTAARERIERVRTSNTG